MLDRKSCHGSFSYPGAARPESLEQEHGHRGHRVLRRRRMLHRKPARFRAPAARAPAADRRAAARWPPGRGVHRARAADRGADPAGLRRLPRHLRPHRGYGRARRVPGRGRIQRGRSGPPGHGPGLRTGAGRPGRYALRSGRRAQAPARAGRRRAPGAQHGRHRPCRRGPQHPLPPAHAGQHGAVRLGQQAAPHPGRRNRSHQRHFRVHRPG